MSSENEKVRRSLKRSNVVTTAGFFCLFLAAVIWWFDRQESLTEVLTLIGAGLALIQGISLVSFVDALSRLATAIRTSRSKRESIHSEVSRGEDDEGQGEAAGSSGELREGSSSDQADEPGGGDEEGSQGRSSIS